MKKISFLMATLFFSLVLLSACKPEKVMETSVAPPASETFTATTPPPTAGPYVDYRPELFKKLKGQEKFILFFHASWCPTCRKLDKNINANLDQLPENAILKIDYDTATELKKQYGVRVQHTLVFYNENGEIVKTGIGTRIGEILEFLTP